MTFEYREVFNDALIKGEIKLALWKYQCTFCNKTIDGWLSDSKVLGFLWLCEAT